MLGKTGVSLLKCCCRNVTLKKDCGSFHFVSKSFTTSNCHRKVLKSLTISKMRDEFLNAEKEKFQDTFGDIENFELKFLKAVEDPEDVEKYLKAKKAQGKSVRNYISEIKLHLSNHDYKKAINVLEVDMVMDKKPVVSHIYDMLVAYNAKLGDLKEAYRLFIQMKRRQGMVSGGMYTSLFVACANCKNSFYALEKAVAIRESLMNDKRHKANIVNYNAMLKAFAWHGDMATTLKIFDEILERRDKVRNCTYSFLFHACISDKNSGLRFALLFWRKMLQNKVKPNLYTFNLLLSCVKECSFGLVESIDDLARQIQQESDKFYRRKVITKTLSDGIKVRKVLKIPSDGTGLTSVAENGGGDNPGKTQTTEIEVEDNLTASESNNEISGNDKNSSESTLTLCPADSSSDDEENKDLHSSLECSADSVFNGDNLPNLIALKPTFGSVVSFNAMTKPYERFMCLGGLEGFLKVMSEFEVKPDVKTMTSILSVVEPNREVEELIIAKAREYKIKLDVTFFNVLIKRRNLRSDFESIEDVLIKMQKAGISPNLMTFGVLALGCKTYKEGVRLLDSLHEFGFRANKEILGALLHNAGVSLDAEYVKAVLNAAKKDEMEPCPKFLSQLKTVLFSLKRKSQTLANDSVEKKISESVEKQFLTNFVEESKKVEEITST